VVLFLSGEVCAWCGRSKGGSKFKICTCEHGVSAVLCGRCAMYFRMGYVLCKECKKHYHRADSDRCWSCEFNEANYEEDDDDPFDSVV
jgi:hypothetical protein